MRAQRQPGFLWLWLCVDLLTDEARSFLPEAEKETGLTPASRSHGMIGDNLPMAEEPRHLEFQFVRVRTDDELATYATLNCLVCGLEAEVVEAGCAGSRLRKEDIHALSRLEGRRASHGRQHDCGGRLPVRHPGRDRSGASAQGLQRGSDEQTSARGRQGDQPAARHSASDDCGDAGLPADRDARGRLHRLLRPSGMKPGQAGLRLAMILLALGGHGGAPSLAAPGPAVTSRLAIEPLTMIGPEGSGYLADPQPVRLAPFAGKDVQLLSGTTHAIIRGAYPIAPGSFTWTPVKVDIGSLRDQVAAAGATVTNFQNLDLFQDDAGAWHAAVTIGVHTAGHPRHWTVIAHAHPTASTLPGTVPLAWSADTVLSGSLSAPARGNYDGKFFEDAGRLYLLYVQTVAQAPALRNAIVLQSMRSPIEPDAAVAPVTLLAPGDRYGPLASERYGQTEAELVEAPFLTRIAGRYALIYSTGAYLTPGYKAGVAWSDTLLPSTSGRYRKVLAPDPLEVWGPAGRPEVRYLVQSARPRWPGFTGDQVVGPGVAAAVQGPEGAWLLFFNGFTPDDMPQGPSGQVDGSHRRPFALGLRVAIPAGQSVATTSDADLAGWLQPLAR